MISNFLTYLMIGVAFNFITDILMDWLETENRLTIKEKIIVTFIWPIAVVTMVYHFIKASTNGPD